MKMVMLDATAGNRMMWPNKNPPLTVFMDKKTDLKISPDVIGVWEYAPFRDDVFSCIIFDPPHIIRLGGGNPIKFRLHEHYGCWNNRRDAIIAIYKAQKEFSRISKRLCFKWCDTRDGPKYWGLLPLFRPHWKKIFERRHKTKGQGYLYVYWATFILSKSN